jgi:hypothetical protein
MISFLSARRTEVLAIGTVVLMSIWAITGQQVIGLSDYFFAGLAFLNGIVLLLGLDNNEEDDKK